MPAMKKIYAHDISEEITIAYVAGVNVSLQTHQPPLFEQHQINITCVN